MTRVKVGLIGVGDVAQRDYLPEWHRLSEYADLAWVCSRTEARARHVAEIYSVANWCTDYEEMFASDIEAVLNLTPIGQHERVTLAALEAGRHVYTEKPLALTSSSAEGLRRVAAERHLVLACAPSVLLFPQILQIGEILRSGELGTIHSARGQALAGVPPWPDYMSDPSPFFEAEAGPLMDMAVYPLHVLTGLLGQVSEVAAFSSCSQTSFTIPEGPFEGQVVNIDSPDMWQLLLKVGDCVASVEASFATVASPSADCELRGRNGGVAFSLFDVSADIRMLAAREPEWSSIPVRHERAAGPDHVVGVLHFLECIQTGREPVLSAVQAVHVLEVIEAARLSAEFGRTVAVSASGELFAPGLVLGGST